MRPKIETRQGKGMISQANALELYESLKDFIAHRDDEAFKRSMCAILTADNIPFKVTRKGEIQILEQHENVVPIRRAA